MYHDVVLQYWGEDLQAIKVKIAQIELPFEIYSASVDDISRALYRAEALTDCRLKSIKKLSYTITLRFRISL
jgi:hypothetical protein